MQHQPWAPADLQDEDIYDYGLYLVQQLVEDARFTMECVHMDCCQSNWAQCGEENRLIQEQLLLQREQPVCAAEELHAQLNVEQRAAFDQVYTSVTEGQGQTLFLNGPAGTGKTLLYKALCYKLHAEGHIVLCVASSGIASLLLPGGRTFHSRFKFPLNIHESSTCSNSKNSALGKLIAWTKLIIWDEVPMQHQFCAQAFNRTSQDRCSNPGQDFGGITVVFEGNFRQILPVIPHGEPEQIMTACLKHSELWPRMRKLQLTQNMWLQGDQAAADFAAWLLCLGEGANIAAGHSGEVAFPPQMLVCSHDELINTLYPQIAVPGHATDQYLRDHTILTGQNNDVLLLSKKTLESLPGKVKVYHSGDKVKTEEGVNNTETIHLSPEYLNSLNTAGLPLARLELKVGCLVMILRNLAPSQGVCNGTRAVVTKLGTRMLEVRLLNGSEEGRILDSIFYDLFTDFGSQEKQFLYHELLLILQNLSLVLSCSNFSFLSGLHLQ